jgi:hypothetical protein
VWCVRWGRKEGRETGREEGEGGREGAHLADDLLRSPHLLLHFLRQ